MNFTGLARLRISVVMILALFIVACGDDEQSTTQPIGTVTPSAVDVSTTGPGSGAEPDSTRAPTPAAIPSPLPTATTAEQAPKEADAIVTSGGGDSEQGSSLTSRVQSCLIDTLGSGVVQQLFEGQRLPTAAELKTLESCGFGPIPSLEGDSTADVPPDVLKELESCLVDALGEGVYADVTGGVRRPTAEETQLFARCHETV
ncbi:MAG: hypothetical protein O3A47_11825, partial [Chloroflexi bacterium]|nr:hypothetical protein [Chloroflexota bacterium]